MLTIILKYWKSCDLLWLQNVVCSHGTMDILVYRRSLSSEQVFALLINFKFSIYGPFFRPMTYLYWCPHYIIINDIPLLVPSSLSMTYLYWCPHDLLINDIPLLVPSSLSMTYFYWCPHDILINDIPLLVPPWHPYQ